MQVRAAHSLPDYEVATIVGSIDMAMLEALSHFSAIREGNLEVISTTLRHEIGGPLRLATTSAQLIRLKANAPFAAGLAQQVTAHFADVNVLIDKLLDPTVLHQHIGFPCRAASSIWTPWRSRRQRK